MVEAKELYGYEASAKDYNDAAAALKEAYKELTGTSLDKVKHTVTVEGSKASNTGAGEYLAGETVTISAGKEKADINSKAGQPMALNLKMKASGRHNIRYA